MSEEEHDQVQGPVVLSICTKKYAEKGTRKGAALSEGLKDAVLMLPNYNVEKLRQE